MIQRCGDKYRVNIDGICSAWRKSGWTDIIRGHMTDGEQLLKVEKVETQTENLLKDSGREVGVFDLHENGSAYYVRGKDFHMLIVNGKTSEGLVATPLHVDEYTATPEGKVSEWTS